MALRNFALYAPDFLLHTPDLYVLRAVVMALSTSSAVAAGIVPSMLPVDGEYTSKVFPWAGLCHDPSMYSCLFGMFMVIAVGLSVKEMILQCLL